jgi:hypothetical protein
VSLLSRLHALEQLQPARRRIVVYYEDSRWAGETDDDAMARQGITPAPGDVVIRVVYVSAQEEPPDVLTR